MTFTAPLSLRDKKRAETRARLERAAVELVARDGLAHTTVDAISEAADVSPRTFFNYFDSKEDAITGVHDIELTDEVVEQHIAEHPDADVVESAVALLFGVIGPGLTSNDLHLLRKEIVKSNPALLTRHMMQMTRMAGQMTAALTTLLARDPAFADDPHDSEAMAELLLTLCGGALRVAMREYVSAGSATPTDQLVDRAVSLVREVTKKLQ